MKQEKREEARRRVGPHFACSLPKLESSMEFRERKRK